MEPHTQVRPGLAIELGSGSKGTVIFRVCENDCHDAESKFKFSKEAT
jgi:hypothetical protein